jgi:hypothetical protein
MYMLEEEDCVHAVMQGHNRSVVSSVAVAEGAEPRSSS